MLDHQPKTTTFQLKKTSPLLRTCAQSWCLFRSFWERKELGIYHLYSTISTLILMIFGWILLFRKNRTHAELIAAIPSKIVFQYQLVYIILMPFMTLSRQYKQLGTLKRPISWRLYWYIYICPFIFVLWSLCKYFDEYFPNAPCMSHTCILHINVAFRTSLTFVLIDSLKLPSWCTYRYSFQEWYQVKTRCLLWV